MSLNLLADMKNFDIIKQSEYSNNKNKIYIEKKT